MSKTGNPLGCGVVFVFYYVTHIEFEVINYIFRHFVFEELLCQQNVMCCMCGPTIDNSFPSFLMRSRSSTEIIYILSTGLYLNTLIAIRINS